MEEIIITIIVSSVVLFIYYVIKESIEGNRDAKLLMEREAKESEYKKENDNLLPVLTEGKNLLIDQYGNITKEINITKDDIHRPFDSDSTWTWMSNKIENFIFVFAESSHIFICGKTFKFKEILKVNLINHATNTNQQLIPTHTSTGDVIGRGIIGGAIAGPIGAVIGGATAKPTYSSDDIETQRLKAELAIVSNYSTIEITVDDFSNSLINIELNNYTNKTREILSVLQIIINKNDEE